MEGCVSYEALDRVKKEICSNLHDLKDDVDKRFDKLFSCYEKLKTDVAKLETHVEYTKEAFDEIRGAIEKEGSLMWKELGDQKSFFVNTINTEITKTEDLLTAAKRDIPNNFTSTCEATQKLLTATITQSIQKIQIRFWISVATGCISLTISIALLVLRKVLGG